MKKTLKKSQLVILMCWLLYTSSYFGKYSYSTNINSILSHYNQTKTATGLVSTFFFFAYGLGQILFALICNKINKKIVLPLALFVSAFCNLAIFLGIPFEFIKFLWLINGLSLSCLWASILLFISENLTKKDFSKGVVIIGTTTGVGTGLSYAVSALFATIGNFMLTFLFGTVVLVIIGLSWFFTYDKMLISKEEKELEDKDYSDKDKNKNIEKYQGKVNWFFFLSIGLFVLFCIVNSLMRDGLTTWIPNLLNEEYNLPNNVSIILSMLIPLAGIGGVVLVTKLSATKINDYLQVAIMFFGILIFIGGIILLFNTSFVVIIAFVIIINFFAHGINGLLTSISPLRYGITKKINCGLLAGILNGASYIGAMISTYLFGYVLDNYSWNTIFIICAISSIVMIGIALICFTYCKLKKPEKK